MFLNLHNGRIDALTAKVRRERPTQTSTMVSAAAAPAVIKAAAALGITVPSTGITVEDLHYRFAAAKPVPFAKRIELKNRLAAAGLLIEPPTREQERDAVRAALMLKKAGIAVPTKYQFTAAELDAELAKTNLPVSDKLEIKSACHAAGLLDDGVVSAPLNRPDASVANNICASLDIDPPAPGQKLSLAAVNRAIKAKGFDAMKAMDIKDRLHAAGALH
jgi:hypothetical protein